MARILGPKGILERANVRARGANIMRECFERTTMDRHVAFA